MSQTRFDRQSFPDRYRCLDFSPEEINIDIFVFRKSPNSGSDLRVGTIGGSCKKSTISRNQFHGLTWKNPILLLFDRTGKNPGMVLQQRFLAVMFYYKFRHVFSLAQARLYFQIIIGS